MRAALKGLFDYGKSVGSINSKKRKQGPLSELYVDGFDEEQIFEQLQLENKPVLKRLRKKSKLLCKQIETIRLFEDQEEEEEEEENSDSSMNSEDENDTDVEIETKEDELEDVGPSSEPKKRKRKVRSKKEDNSHGLNDEFFSLEAMERFADQEEALMRGETQEEDEDWMNAMYGATPKQNSKPEAGGDARFDEFFAPPGEEMEEEMEEEEEEEEEEDAQDVSTSSSSDDDSSESEEEEEEKKEEIRKPAELSEFAKRQIALRDKIKALEDEAVEKRKWTLNGEATKKKRPENSLLETVLEYDRADKMAPVITIESTQTLEDRIKQRILDEAWDDVVRIAPPDLSKDKKEELVDLSTEKSRQGLGELYEHEYMQKQFGVGNDSEERKKREEKAMTMFRTLCTTLDALSSSYSNPIPDMEKELEIKVVNAPSINMEEVLPMSVSQDMASVPEELLKRASGNAPLRGKDELSSDKKQAMRRAKKSARRKRQIIKRAEERMVAKMRPGLGNPYAEKRMLEKMRSSGQLKEGVITGGAKMTKSTQFFKELQDTVKNEARSIKTAIGIDVGGEKKKKRKASSMGGKFKL